MALDKIRTELIADDAVTAAKIPTGAIGTTEIAEGALSVHALQNTTSHTLSGTYTDSKMYTSDAYVLGGDITVNSNLVLSSVKGDDSDITLTDDGTTRTITGTGKLEAGAILAKTPTPSLTGMTGALGSTVTGSPALNLNNATQFPAGQVLNVTSRANKTQTYVTGSTYTGSDCYHSITTTNGNYVWIIASCPINVYAGSAAIDSTSMVMQIQHSTDNSSFSYIQDIQGDVVADKQHAAHTHNYTGNLPAYFAKHNVQTLQFLHGPVIGTTQYYKVYLKYNGHTGTGHAAIMNPDSNTWGGMTLMEVQA